MDPTTVHAPGMVTPASQPRTYWMVHAGNPNQPSSVMHYSQRSAEDEAKRLAECNIGKAFFVLQATSMFQVSLPKAMQSFLD